MAGFFRRRRPDGAIAGGAMLAAAIAACLSGLTPEARAQDEQLSRTGQAGHPIIVGEHAGWSSDCDAIAPPTLYLYESPRHGSLCTRVANIEVHAMYVGTESQCVGRVVRGIQFVYQPDRGYTGSDGLRYAAQYPSVRRMLSVTITVAAQSRAAPGAVPSNSVDPIPRGPFSATPVPSCDALIF
jgi:hypothetical protein